MRRGVSGVLRNRERGQLMGANEIVSDQVPAWVRQATALPLAFAQVREDPLIDLWVVERLRKGAEAFMIASGGCTAALLATAPNLARLRLIDMNPAQLAITRLKLRLLQTCEPSARLELLGHKPMATPHRARLLESHLGALELPATALGPVDLTAKVGPDYAGRYERAFAELQRLLADQADELSSLLRLADPIEQRRRAAPATALGRRLDEALDAALSLPNLVALFGSEATNNPVLPFCRHFALRIRQALAAFEAARNPYLWQMLRGVYPEGAVSPWLEKPAPPRMPSITLSISPAAAALREEKAAFDFVHLSNILDWLRPEQAIDTLEAAAGALRPGGWVLIRQLNSTLDIPALGGMFDWSEQEAADLHARDRSFFYRALCLGRKR